MTESEPELLERHRRVMPGWLSLYYERPVEIVRGSGRHVWDADGNRYLDFFGGISTTLTGHDVAEVVEAIREQAGRVIHTSTLYLVRPMVELAERIAALAPMPEARVFFVGSGTEANDTALLLATAFTGSNQVLALRNGYHGRSVSTQAVTGNRFWSASPWTPFAVTYVPNGDSLRGPQQGLSGDKLIEACTADLRYTIDTQTAGTLACLIAEPVQGVGGLNTPPDGLFAAYRDVVSDYGALLISDEVQTGWGRTGEHFWGIQAHAVEPDVVTFAKGVGNGLGIGGVIARPDVMDCIGAHSISTFGGNPLVSAGALANVEYLMSHDLQSNAAARGAELFDVLGPLPARLPAVLDVRGKGLMVGVELVEPGTDTPDPARAAAVHERVRAGGLLVGKGGLYDNVVRLLPPLSVTASEVAEACGVLVSALEEVGG